VLRDGDGLTTAPPGRRSIPGDIQQIN